MELNYFAYEFVSQNSAKAHVALQYLQISVTYPRSQYFHQCILFIRNGGQRMVGKEGAIVEEFGGLGFFGVDDEGLHCGGERRSHFLLLADNILQQ